MRNSSWLRPGLKPVCCTQNKIRSEWRDLCIPRVCFYPPLALILLLVVIYGSAAVSIYKNPIAGVVIFQGTWLKMFLSWKSFPSLFWVNLCFLISAFFCLSDHKEKVLAMPAAEITHGNSAGWIIISLRQQVHQAKSTPDPYTTA